MNSEPKSPTRVEVDGLYAYRGGSFNTFEEAVKHGGAYLSTPIQFLTKPLFDAAKNVRHAIGESDLEFVVVINGRELDPDVFFKIPENDEFASYAYYSTEGSELFKKLGEPVRVHFLEVGEDDDEIQDLQLTLTDEGVIIDLVGQASGDVIKSCAFDRDALVALCS